MAELGEYGEDPLEAETLTVARSLEELGVPSASASDESGWDSAKIVLARLEYAAEEAELMAELRLGDAAQRFRKEVVAIEETLEELHPSASRETRQRGREKLRRLVMPLVEPLSEIRSPAAGRGTLYLDTTSRSVLAPQDESTGYSNGHRRSSTEASLSAFAKYTLRNIQPAKKGLSSFDEVREHEQWISAIQESGRRASEWLAVAKSTDDEMLRALALGEGFYEQGEAYLRVRRKGAKDFLRDSAGMFSLANTSDDRRLERALLALCVERSYSEYSIGERGFSIDPASWLQNPEEMFRWLERGTNFRTLALEWLEVNDPLAEQLYSFLERRVQHHEQLRSQFAAVCLMGRELRHRLRHCLARCGRLLDSLADHTLSRLWNHLIDAAPEAQNSTSGEGDIRLFEARVREVVNYLRLLPGTVAGVAPLPQLSEGLNRLLDGSIEAASEPKALELDVEILVDRFYPEERMRDCMVPVRVSNPAANVAVQDARVRLSLAPGSKIQSVRIEQDEEMVGTLIPGDDAQRWFYINFAPRITEKAAESTLRLEWNVGERAGYVQKKVVLRPGTREADRSPYNAGRSVTGESFVGRDKQLAHILGALVDTENPQPVLVYGIRRIGKTSLLKRVLTDPRVGDRFQVVEWDVQDLPDSSTTDEVAVRLCNQVLKVLPRKSRGGLDFSREKMREDPYGELEKFFDAVRIAAPQKQILLAVDEFDRMMELADVSERAAAKRDVPPPPSEMFQRRFFGALRKEVMKDRGATLLVAGLPRIFHAQSYDDRLFGLFKPVVVGRLTESEADRIINSSRVLEHMHPLARKRIHEATGLQPYLLQVLCQQLFSRMVESGRDPATRGDVEAVINEIMLPNENYFSDYASLIKGDEEVLWALAMATPDRRFATASEVTTVLRDRGISGDPERVAEVLETYRSDGGGGDERPIVETAAGGRRNRYRFVIGILKDYLLRRFES